ncbi:MAG: FAD-binding oxidoreductase [Pyrinomonadaceae bacterium]
MLTKSDPDEIQSFLFDASYLKGGFASGIVFPESGEEVAEVLTRATRERTPVTISGAGTGTVAGRVPFGGIVLATDKLNQIKSLVKEETGGRAVVEAGVVLSDLQRFVDSEGLLYPPDPTERSCFVGGTVATNASGARTFKYGPTRNYVERLKIALGTGDLIDLKRGTLRANASGRMEIPLTSGRIIEARLPSYRMPQVRKHASGYYVVPGMDVLDLFIGSEGTLGVILEAEVRLLAKPEGFFSGIVFFAFESALLAFVAEARAASLQTRQHATAGDHAESIDARALEYFDRESLRFLRQKYDAVPLDAVGAVFFEQETTQTTEDVLMSKWLSLLEQHQAMIDESWFATNEQDQARLREFRHQLPVLMNEWFARYSQRKVSTDMAVPDREFAGMLLFYAQMLQASDLRYTIFGHIGDNHIHVNILPRNSKEAAKAHELYTRFVRRAVAVGGTISAEHGIGKLKREYLNLLYTDRHLREMSAIKRAFDPAGILGRGNIFSEEYL